MEEGRWHSDESKSTRRHLHRHHLSFNVFILSKRNAPSQRQAYSALLNTQISHRQTTHTHTGGGRDEHINSRRGSQVEHHPLGEKSNLENCDRRHCNRKIIHLQPGEEHVHSVI